MKKTTCLIDDNGIELLVSYDIDFDHSYFAEPGNANTFVPATYTVTIDMVELVVASKGIDITRQLDKRQLDHIINEINEAEWFSLPA